MIFRTVRARVLVVIGVFAALWTFGLPAVVAGSFADTPWVESYWMNVSIAGGVLLALALTIGLIVSAAVWIARGARS